MTAHHGRSHRTVAALLLVAMAAGFVIAGSARAGAAAPPVESSLAAEYGARWVAARVNAEGFVPGPTDDPNVSATIDTALALQQAGVEGTTYASILAWLQSNVELAIDPDGTTDSAGNIGKLLLLSAGAGIDPTAFGGEDLVSRLAATLGAFAPGLYGASDPTYDGSFRHALAVLGLRAVGRPVPPAAVAWLAAQQCDATTPTAEGGWQPYRADLGIPCDAPDEMTFMGPDTNSSALAVQAMVAAGGWDAAARVAALDFLAAAQGADGGFPFIPGGTVDPNSTSLVILGIIAGGEDPSTGRWLVGTATPYSSLLGWQLACPAAVEDRGAFASPFSNGAADDYATRQAVWGAAGRPFGATGARTFAVAAVPCEPLQVASTTTTTSTTSTTSTTTTAPPGGGIVAPSMTAAPAAVVVGATPRFAG